MTAITIGSKVSKVVQINLLKVNYINQFVPNALFLYPLKTSENLEKNELSRASCRDTALHLK